MFRKRYWCWRCKLGRCPVVECGAEIVQCHCSLQQLGLLKLQYFIAKCLKPLIITSLQPKMSKIIHFLCKAFKIYINACICHDFYFL